MSLLLGADLVVISSEPGDAPIPLRAAERVAAPDPARRELEAMVRVHHEALLSFATRLSGNPADARDLVQDTLERALRRASSFVPGTNARAWLFSILHHAFIDRCRCHKARPRTASIDEVEVPATDPEEPPRWTSITPEELAHAVATLEEEFRVIYELHARDGLSYQAIAVRLGMPTNTVGTRLARARRKLRTLLESRLEERGGR